MCVPFSICSSSQSCKDVCASNLNSLSTPQRLSPLKSSLTEFTTKTGLRSTFVITTHTTHFTPHALAATLKPRGIVNHSLQIIPALLPKLLKPKSHSYGIIDEPTKTHIVLSYGLNILFYIQLIIGSWAAWHLKSKQKRGYDRWAMCDEM